MVDALSLEGAGSRRAPVGSTAYRADLAAQHRRMDLCASLRQGGGRERVLAPWLAGDA
jgi:hypothetical protein